ncbi:uncharacterized protein Dana_GF16776, isoform A [Drosophila ananassae]|uniref:Uncharacterized protein, isoform A n=1 Tax=Drosophila ananassae TaxID=7217 RepID=B3LYK7_DROAN|nr:alpha-taxilin [Drosophila ananassae]EDV42922.1 uncharacterized protein Dana_GF16776, isoform A [Drosophila ananassae]
MEKLGKAKAKAAREEKQKEQKLEELVLKSLEECTTPEDKVKLLLQRHVDSEKNVSRLTGELRILQRHMESQQREKEQVQRDLNRSVLMRDKLQEVCREQQRIIKSVKNESMLQIKVEEERRKESQTNFQSSLNEVQKSLAKNNEENIKLRDYNIEMTKKLKLLAEQYQTREQHLEKLNEQVQLEAQLHQAKLNKVQVEAAMEKEILSKENQIGLEKLLQAQRAIKDLTERENQLKEQLNIYTAKYDDFQQSLQKSNEVFGSYKVELEKMSKHTKKIEKEALAWRQKYEKANAMVIDLATEKQLSSQHSDRLQKQIQQLQKLLRALQQERTTLHKSLRDNNIEIPALPQLPPEPEPVNDKPTQENVKMEMMSRNCAELKQTLANLQNQMKLLTATESKTALEEKNKAAEEQRQANNAKKNNRKKEKKSKAKAAAAAAAAAVSSTSEEQLSSIQDQPTLELQAAGDASNVKETQEQTVQTVPESEAISSEDSLTPPFDVSEVPALIDANAE